MLVDQKLWKFFFLYNYPGFPGGSVVKNRPASAGDAEDLCSILGLRRSSGEGNDNPFQYSCLENSMHRGAWQATVHGVTKTNPANYLQTILSFAFGLQKKPKSFTIWILKETVNPYFKQLLCLMSHFYVCNI